MDWSWNSIIPTATLESLRELMVFNPQEPMIFSSGLFLFLFTAFVLIYGIMRKWVNARILYVAAFSLLFYYKSSGVYFWLLIFASVSDYTLAQYIHASKSAKIRKLFVALSVMINLGMLGYFKYTNFFIEIANGMFGAGFLDFQNIFLPVGISFFVFQSLSYTIDIYRGNIKPLDRWIDYLFYLSFFPQLVAGPIVRAKDFIPQIRKPLYVSKEMFSGAIFLIATGLFKKAIISDYISLNFVDRVFDEPLLYSGFEALMAIYGYALQIYCDFSGYSDMAIGIALLLGFHFPANFNAPYKSATITEFWRRWHISLSSWLRDYLYISLGGNRKGEGRTYLNLLITMLLGGLWHGAAVRFILWGALHGVALAIHKLWMKVIPWAKGEGAEMNILFRVVGILLTFNVVCFGWLMFRADDMATVSAMLHQIMYSFNSELIPQVLSGYRLIFTMIALGFILHMLPHRLSDWTRTQISKVPLWAQVAVVVVVVWMVMQIKSSDIQPFIYFQF
ncbi:MAG: MBOAT family protein [Rikenellaceae bacterium]